MHIEKKCAKGSAAAAMPSTKGWPRGFFAVYRQEKTPQNVPCGTF
jgi:hypothetical protein